MSVEVVPEGRITCELIRELPGIVIEEVTTIAKLPESPPKSVPSPNLLESPPKPPSLVTTPITSPERRRPSSAKNLLPIFEELYQTSPPKKPVAPEEKLPELENLTVEYGGRNILDLGSNIGWGWNYRPSVSSYIDRNFYKFTETSGRYTVVRRIREKNGRCYYFYPMEEALESLH